METFTENEKIVLEKDGKTYEYDVLLIIQLEKTEDKIFMFRQLIHFLLMGSYKILRILENLQ